MAGLTSPSDPVLAMWPLLVRRMHALCGLSLEQDQAYLLASRLEPVARRLGYPTLLSFLSVALIGKSSDLDRELIEAMTTHETSFFRDEAFWATARRRVLPALAERADGRPLRIWSAACSTGQEPYSLAMLLAETYPGMAWEIWATDVAASTLARAAKGVFSEVEVGRGLSPGMRARWFARAPDGASWTIAPELRARVRFERWNLLGSAPPPGPFDVTLCRNVLVYFDARDRDVVLARLASSLSRQGWLGLGSTEVPLARIDELDRVPEGGGWMTR